MRKFMSVKFKNWPQAEDFVRKVFVKYTSPHELFKFSKSQSYFQIT